MSDSEVDAGSNEGRCNHQTHNLKSETRVAPRIIIQHDAAAVPQAFEDTACAYCEGIAPKSIASDQRDVSDGKDAEDGEEEGIGCQIWVVAISRSLQCTEIRDLSAIAVQSPRRSSSRVRRHRDRKWSSPPLEKIEICRPLAHEQSGRAVQLVFIHTPVFNPSDSDKSWCYGCLFATRKLLQWVALSCPLPEPCSFVKCEALSPSRLEVRDLCEAEYEAVKRDPLQSLADLGCIYYILQLLRKFA